ncbi:uncharacterized protein LOC134810958 [Bolinopsis microptera]|uniref:uncharacterized protein LOC134810958 n=1 Tax=Bolinopsis microptera TaxID=2820187 RepID=UPI00307A5BF8
MSTDRQIILQKIESIISDIARSLSRNETPKYTILSKSRSNVQRDAASIQLGTATTEIEMFGRQGASTLKFSKWFSQNDFNRCFEDVLRILDVPRRALGLSAAPKGSIAGAVKVKQGSEEIDCLLLGNSGYELPGDMSNVKLESLGARYVLVVEKDAVFKTLCDKVIWNQVPCILITGRGYPGLAVREVVSRCEQDFKLPVLGLFDYNPHGLQILLTYRFGSTRMGREGIQYTSNIQWLGLHWFDVKDADAKHFKKFGKKDTQVCDSLLSQPFVNQRQRYYNEVAQMKRHRVKLELESIDDMKEFVVNKILKKKYFDDRFHEC